MWKPVLVLYVYANIPSLICLFFNMGYRANSCCKVLYQLSHIPSLLPSLIIVRWYHIILGWLWTYYVAKDGFERLNFQPLPPKSL